MSRLSHKQMRELVVAAFAKQLGRAPNTTESQCLQAVAWLETNYASSWKGAGIGSWNFGAIQKGGWKGEFFEYTDTHPNADGTSTPYRIGFRKYPTAEAGVEDLCRVVYQAFGTRQQALACAGKGDTLGFSTWLNKYPAYYEGFGRTAAERIANHHKAVLSAIRLQCVELGESMPGADLPSPSQPPKAGKWPTPAEVQHAVNGLIMRHLDDNPPGLLTVDGIIGPKSTAALEWAQRILGIPVTGNPDAATCHALGLS